jgi:hypothetical protein
MGGSLVRRRSFHRILQRLDDVLAGWRLCDWSTDPTPVVGAQPGHFEVTKFGERKNLEPMSGR